MSQAGCLRKIIWQNAEKMLANCYFYDMIKMFTGKKQIKLFVSLRETFST
jgi:hypothetical protein